jgi:hypothetical protein
MSKARNTSSQMALDQMQRRSESIVSMLSSLEKEQDNDTDPEFLKAKKSFDVVLLNKGSKTTEELCDSWSHMSQTQKTKKSDLFGVEESK